ncbi:MAG: efflux transporter outer membrane subunit [Verrucomicrobiae bacterium]|nr:efflux transporter outer membrane subunit [Verrucomicrobiae bacterium]
MKTSPSLLLSLTPLLLLCSCAVGPDYKRPEDLPEMKAFRSPLAPDTQKSLANLKWWEMYNDPELTALIKNALESSPDMKLAIARVEEFRARAGLSRSQGLPQMGIGGGATEQYTSFRSTYPTDTGLYSIPAGQIRDTYSASASFSWELDFWGRIKRANEVARAQLAAQEDFQRGVIISLVAETATGYFLLRDFDAQLAISQTTLKDRQEAMRIGKARFDKGLISELDYKQFEADVASSMRQIAEFQGQVSLQENNLSVLVGRVPSAITRGKSLSAQKLPADIPSGLPADLLLRRPDLLQAEASLRAATANIGFQIANRYPKFALTGSFGASGPDLVRTIAGGLGLNWNILDGGRGRAEVDIARAQAAQAVAQYEKAILNAFREVDNALVLVKSTRAQWTALRDQVAALQVANDISGKRYEQGLVTYLDVITTERDLLNAQLQLSQVHRAYLVAVVDLYKALGGGWDEVAPTPQTAEKMTGDMGTEKK